MPCIHTNSCQCQHEILHGNANPKCIGLRPGGHSNTSVVHMRDQRFSKHTVRKRDFPYPGKTPQNENLTQFCSKIYPKQAFFGGLIWWSLKNDPKRPLIESKSLKKQPFFNVSLVAHVYSTII